MNKLSFKMNITILGVLTMLSSCYKIPGSYGYKKLPDNLNRNFIPEDVAVPPGYKVSQFCKDLTFPTAITFDENGTAYTIESGYSYGEEFTLPRLLKISDGKTIEIAKGSKNGPWTGLQYYKGYFYVAEGGTLDGGKILKISKEGVIQTLVDSLPTRGDHHTNGPAIGADDYLYFSLGTATNSGVVGEDSYKFGWLKRFPAFHDVPCADITLTGVNYTTDNPLTEAKDDEATTGAYLPFGTPSEPGQVIRGKVPCTGAVMRVPIEGGQPELFAWGLRNPFGLAFDKQGRLFITENGMDTRGSRPGYGNSDVLWEIQKGKWYGWPDFTEGRLLSDEDFETPHNDPKLLLKNKPSQPPMPVALLGVNSSSNGLDFSPGSSFGYEGQVFIAQFGDMSPAVGKIYGPVGFKVIRVDLKTGDIQDFAVNKGKRTAPATELKHGGLERPIDVKFDGKGDMYVVDFGIMPVSQKGPIPIKGTGGIWKISKL